MQYVFISIARNTTKAVLENPSDKKKVRVLCEQRTSNLKIKSFSAISLNKFGSLL